MVLVWAQFDVLFNAGFRMDPVSVHSWMQKLCFFFKGPDRYCLTHTLDLPESPYRV